MLRTERMEALDDIDKYISALDDFVRENIRSRMCFDDRYDCRLLLKFIAIADRYKTLAHESRDSDDRTNAAFYFDSAAGTAHGIRRYRDAAKFYTSAQKMGTGNAEYYKNDARIVRNLAARERLLEGKRFIGRYLVKRWLKKRDGRENGK